MSQQGFLQANFGINSDVYDAKVRFKSFQLDNSVPADKRAASTTDGAVHLQSTAKVRRQQRLKLSNTGKNKVEYRQFKPLNTLWREYMITSVLSRAGQKESSHSLMTRVLKADWHGAEIEVVESKCPSLVGIKGILVQELENTFRIVTPLNRLKTVPKIHSIFRLKCTDNQSFKIYGAHILCKSADRMVRKWKDRPTIEL